MTHSPIEPYVIATRESRLALFQSQIIKETLESQGYSCTFRKIKTSGDKFLSSSLHEIGGKGLFIKELESALINKEAHFAVHSLKDLPCVLPPNFKLLSFLPRTYPLDYIIFRKDQKSYSLDEKGFFPIKDLHSFTIGTSSLRRKALCLKQNKELKILPVRGNVDTRLKKLSQKNIDALILAEASIKRLKISSCDFTYYPLDPQIFVPSAAQGVIVVESLSSFKTKNLFKTIHCSHTQKQVTFEREILKSLGGSCILPIAVYCFKQDSSFLCSIEILKADGSDFVRYDTKLNLDFDMESSVREIKTKLYDLGVNRILKSLGVESITP